MAWWRRSMMSTAGSSCVASLQGARRRSRRRPIPAQQFMPIGAVTPGDENPANGTMCAPLRLLRRTVQSYAGVPAFSCTVQENADGHRRPGSGIGANRPTHGRFSSQYGGGTSKSRPHIARFARFSSSQGDGASRHEPLCRIRPPRLRAMGVADRRSGEVTRADQGRRAGLVHAGSTKPCTTWSDTGSQS